MADRIVQRISLEGAEDVQAKLRRTEIGAKALEATNKTIEDSKSGLGDFGDFFAGITGKTEESKKAIEGIKKALETIKPAAEDAGLELGRSASSVRSAAPAVSLVLLRRSAARWLPRFEDVFDYKGGADSSPIYPDAVTQLSAAANQAKRYSTGAKPNWYGSARR
ncbi:hypothetical protein [Bradyrhizobium sp. USDA 4502]